MSSGDLDVVRVLAYSDSSVFGGAEAVFCRVARDLARRPRFDVAGATALGNATMFGTLGEATGREPIEVPPQPLRLSAFHLRRARRLRDAAAACAGGRWDVLLVNLPSTEYGATPLLLDLAPVSLGVLHIHHSLARAGFRLGRVRDALGRRVVRRADALAVLSERSKLEVGHWATHPRLSVVPLPRPRVDRVERGLARGCLGLPDGTMVGIAGRVSLRQKGHDVLVDAAARLPEDVQFAVAGDGRDLGALHRLVESRALTGRFHFVGRVEPIDSFLSAIDAIAIPSRFEGLPLVALESLALGLPGIAAAVDGLAEVWPREWLVRPDDPVALADGLDGVLRASKSERDAIVAEAQPLIALRTTEDLGVVYENLILDLIGSVAGEDQS